MPTANPLTQTPGLINTAPGMTDTTPAVVQPDGATPGQPVTGYTPASATATPAGTSTYDPKAFDVGPKATVASQIKDIISSGSPLMEQAETNAKNMMNSRGLINSSQAVGAGQQAVIAAATPIATADAATYAQAGRDTTTAQNTALASDAASKNAAALQDATQKTSTSQFNAGQTNAANSSAAAASNAVSLQQQQNTANLNNIKANREADIAITNLTNTNRTLLQTSSGAQQLYSQMLANLSAIVTNPNMSEAQKATALNDGVQQLNDALSVMSTIAGIPDLKSILTFGPSTPAADTGTPAPDAGTPAQEDTGAQSPAPVPVPASTPTPAATDPTQTPGMMAAKSAPPGGAGSNTPLQDIAAAIAQGRPVSDQSWAQAGYGPGGSAPPAGGLINHRYGRMS